MLSLFPSPCGVKVVANSKVNIMSLLNNSAFPSPCGVKVVANSSKTKTILQI